MKLFCSILVVVGIFTFIPAFVAQRVFPESQYYPLTAKVTGFSSENDMVFAESNDGNIWCFTGTEDWMIGDRCAMVMNDSGTPADPTDDMIVSVRYFI